MDVRLVEETIMLDFGHRRVYFLASYDRSELVRENQEPACPNPVTALETLCFFDRPGRCMGEEIDFGLAGSGGPSWRFSSLDSVDRRTRERQSRVTRHYISTCLRLCSIHVFRTRYPLPGQSAASGYGTQEEEAERRIGDNDHMAQVQAQEEMGRTGAGGSVVGRSVGSY